jgi:hypothetical protein
MKYLLTFIIFFAFAVSLNAQQNVQPIYIGTWVGIENPFRSPYAVVIKDTTLLLIRKNIALRDRIQDLDNPNFLHILDQPGKSDTLALNYKVQAVDNSFQFRLSPKQKVLIQDTSIIAEFRLLEMVPKKHRKAIFSIDFKDGSKIVNTLKLIKL